MGEKLAWMFGITSPKFEHEIEEYNRIKRMEEEDRCDEVIADSYQNNKNKEEDEQIIYNKQDFGQKIFQNESH
jgi:hypothetical protein